MKGLILVIEDDKVLNRLIADHLNLIGFSTLSALSWQEATRHLEAHEPRLIIMDVRLPDANGVDLIPGLATEIPVILLTAYGSVRDAVQAMKAGAAEYLVKPITLDELELMVDKVLANANLLLDHHFCKAQLRSRTHHSMVGESAELQHVRQMVEAVAPNEISVLIQGESGVGKELVAKAIHDCSPRNKRNFIAVDCCTLQEKLFESELFGHERGSFTDAKRQKKGLIEGADGGTLFLDEIGEIEPSIQVKLLRFLETGKFRRLGGTKDLLSNTRIVAATNRDLEEMSRSGGFRSDLYYRLAGFIIEVPTLRKRREDIPALTEHFFQHNNFSRHISKKVSSKAMKMLIAYDWPGNIRELKNMVERAIILSGSTNSILPEHLTACAARLTVPAGFSLSFEEEPELAAIEKKYLGLLLERYSGHRTKIAKILGISERSVYRMLDKYGYKQEDVKKTGNYSA